ncbi:hypothetical protein GCM10010425_57830 [Streptomyces spororaveus]|uniref:Uncharacterized protein n=1 Tax=Streptomyces spororaveus TaxID=284039 RepID=A0ABQ3TJE7_9ACTN|nr:hypothetical protein Sspor_60920 [Streptomyces spororaveus]
MPGAGQPQGLRALAHADVEDAQPLPDREALRDLLVDLPAHELLPDRVAQSAQAFQPEPCPLGEAFPRRAGRPSGQGRSPRLTCGFGRRSRRIWRVRIRP